MAKVRIWYDTEGDFLEVMFKKRKGYFRETKHDDIMEKVDTRGKVIGFSVMNVSKKRKNPLEVKISTKATG